MNWNATQPDYWELFKMFLGFWPIFLLMIALSFMKILSEKLLPDYIHKKKTERRFKKGEKWRSDKELLSWLRDMHPSEFEKYIAHLFTKLGYKAEAVGGSYDGGIDVIAEKEGIKHYIQCKKYITSKVSVGDVRDFTGALIDRLSQGKGIFITTNIFTTEAEKFVEDKPIELVDGDKLLRLVKLANKENKVIENKETEICPTCGGKLIVRKGKFGEFIGCANYPKCRFTKKIVG